MKKEATQVLKLILALAFITGCTKTRQAELPDDVKPNVFAKTDFIVPEETPYLASKELVTPSGTSNSMKALDSVQASTLSGDDVNVPDRLKFMFDKLPMSGQTAKQFKISFSIDKDFVTSYKVVQNAAELTPLENSLAISSTEAQLISKAANSASKDSNTILVARKAAATDRELIKQGKKAGALLVPMFKYKIEGFGVLERTKNELKESTSVLSLKKTDFASATHIQISSLPESRLLIGMNAEQIKEINQLFIESKIDNQVMTATDLQSRLNVGMDFLKPDTKVLTRLDSNVLHIYEITKVSLLGEDELSLLKNTTGNQQVMSCQDPSISKFVNSTDKDCVVRIVAELPVTFKSVKLATDGQGNISDSVQFDNVPRSKSVGLVEILENTAVKQVGLSTALDPKNAIKLSDIMNKEFYFRRTFEDAPSTSMLMPGLAGDLILARFVLENDRLIVRASEKFINYKNQNSNQYEDLMSIRARYIALQRTDGNGSPLTIPKLISADKNVAEYVILDWTENALPIIQSPLSMTTFGQCLGGISNTKVTDISVKTGAEFVLNFTYNYTTVLRQECATYYDTQNYNGGDTTVQQVHNIRERISFRENKIKKEDEKVLSAQVPFPAQNKMGYGLFTKGIITPTENGNRNLGDGQLDLPIIHDFTNGQKLVYTIGGLSDNDPQRQMIIDLTKEVVDDWNKSLQIAFKGTSLERSGSYIEAVVNGEGSEKGFLGDTDKNYIWYDDKINEGMSVIGVSQAGSHPRTGTIIADQVVMYLGNSRSYIEATVRAAKIAKEYKLMLENFKKTKQAKLANDEKANSSPTSKGSDVDAKDAIKKNLKAQKNYVSQVLQQKKLSPEFRMAPKSLALLPGISGSVLSELRQGSGSSDTKALLAKISLTGKQKPYIKELFAKIMESGSSYTLSDVDAVLAREILKSNGQMMSAQQRSILKLNVQLSEAKSNLQKLFLNRPGCVTFKNSMDYTSKFTDMPFDQALRISLKATLAHEMGHSLGLTHNFIASSDKKNWEFNLETTGRNYSSIMDYQDEARQVYAGPGPYDVHALRAGYTGFVEANDDAVSQIKQNQPGLIKSIDGKNFVQVNTVKDLVANKNWSELTKSSALSVLKPFKYCTDKDLMWEATCRQFDLGGSATEIVNNAIADYNERYGVSRFGYDRREFGWLAKSRVLGRSFDSMLHIRQYLDEVFYKLILERDSLSKEEASDYETAAVNGWFFFHQVLGTPDAEPGSSFLSADRFDVVQYTYQDAQKNEKTDVALVEKKTLQDTWSSEDRIETIGMEEDKIMAMQVLTLRGLPYPKYAMHNFTFSYLDLEKYLLGITEPMNMPTVSVLTKLMTNKLPAMMGTENTPFIQLENKNEVTEAMRVYAAINSIIGLEAQALSAKDNFANLFKVGSTLGAVLKDRVSLSHLDNPKNSKAATYVWAPDNSLASNLVLSQLNRGRIVIANAPDLGKPMKLMIQATLGMTIEAIKAGMTAAEEAQKAGKTPAEAGKLGSEAINSKLVQLIAGRTPEQLNAEIKQKMAAAEIEMLAALKKLNKKEILATAEEIKENPNMAMENQAKLVSAFIQASSQYLLQALSNPDLKSQLGQLKESNKDLAESLPVLALVQKVLVEVTADVPMLKDTAILFVDDQAIENRDNMVMRNMDFLNMITVVVNPGFNR